MKRSTIVSTLSTLALAGALILGVSVSPADAGVKFRSITLKPCATEDSTNCYWDAQRMGNGTGTSFVNLNGVLYYPR